MKRLFEHAAYDFVKITGGIPALIWLRPKWVEASRKKRHIHGGALVVCNHNSFYDPIALMVGLFSRRVRFVATKELFDGKVKRWLFTKAFRCIPIDREHLGMQTFRDVNEALQRDEVVAMFPEGHVLTDQGAGLGTMRSGMVLMAAQSKRPIIPVYVLPPEKWYQRLRIAIADPIAVQSDRPMPTMEEIAKITDEVSTAMRTLREQCLADRKAKK